MDEADIDCAQPAGVFKPEIDRNRCEGKQACVAACPYQVFAMGTLPRAERGALTLRGKLKGFAHRWRQSFAVRADACHACGLCVAVCPEKAIRLLRV
jgi:4Fe-4S ferredoxin